MKGPESSLKVHFHLGLMDDDEVVVVSGVRRFSTYSGYLKTFQFAGPWQGEPTVQAILAMDAATMHHFSQDMVLRDVRKAYLAFQGHSAISTGRWGCGMFGGIASHKFVQQVIAAHLAGVQLHFSMLGTPDGCDEIQSILNEQKPNTAEVLQAILSISTATNTFPRRFAAALSATPKNVYKLTKKSLGDYQQIVEHLKHLI